MEKKMNLKNLFTSLPCLLIFFFLFAGNSMATDYYVNTLTGDDNWTGTAATFQSGNVGPKKTIQAMLDVATVTTGDKIIIAAGTYSETVTLTKRVELVGSGAVTIQNLTLNTGSSTATKINETGFAADMTISGTLLCQSGLYDITSGRLNLASGGTLEIRVTSATAGFDAQIDVIFNLYTLTFSNTSAFTTDNAKMGDANPAAINFNGSALVILGGPLTGSGNLTIASGASVALGANNITTAGNFTNNGSYSGTGKIIMNGANKTITGSGTFMNIQFQNDPGEFEVGSNLTFLNVDVATASLIDLEDGILDLNNFNIETPGSVTVGASYDNAGVIKSTGATTGGKLIFSGTAATLGNVNFTLGQNVSLDYLTINKPTGSTVTIPGGGDRTLTVSKQLDFSSGIFQLNENDLALAAGHGSTAAIGGNLNGTAGSSFTILTTADVTISGAGQINVAFTINGGATKTYTFTQLTTVGNTLTVENGYMVTSSLSLINGLVTLNNDSRLTLNTTPVSMTNNLDVNGTADVLGTSSITVQGTIDLETGCTINKSAGTISSASTFTLNGASTLTAAGASTTVAGGHFTSSTGAINLSGPLSVTGNITFGTQTVNVAGTISATGSIATGDATITTTGGGSITAGTTLAFGVNNDVIAGNVQSGTTLTTGAGNLTVSGNLIAGTTFTSAGGTVTVTGSARSGGHFTVNGAGDVSVGSTLTTTSSGNVVTASTGKLTVTATVTIAGNVVVGDGDIYFEGTGSHSVAGRLTTGAAGGTGIDLRFGGPVTIAGANGIQPGNHVQEWRFDGAVTLTHATTNDIDLKTAAGHAFTIDFYGAVTARDLLMNDSQIHLVTFKTSGTAKPVSQFRNITFVDLGVVINAAAKIELESTDDSYHYVRISNDLNIRPTNVTSTLLTVGANSRIVLNGSAALTTYADNNWQNIDLTGGSMTIANLEAANTGTDASPTDNSGGNAEPDETKESVVITGNNLTVTNLWLTSNGIFGTNLTIADGGIITRSAGAIEIADPAFTGARNLVYSNTSALTTGREYTVAGTLINLTLNGSSTVTMSAARGMTGVLIINVNNTLSTAGAGGPFNLTITNTSATTVATINGSFTGGGTLIDLLNTANVAHTATGTGTVSNFHASTFDNALDVYTFSIANVTGNLTTSGAAGTFNVTTSGPSTVGGNVTLNNDQISFAKAITVTGNLSITAATSFTATGLAISTAGTITKAGAGTWTSGAVTMTGSNKDFTHTAGNITIAGNLTVTGNYTQTVGNLTLTSNGVGSIAGNMTWAQAALTLSGAGDFTVNGSFAAFAGDPGSVVFPAASTSSLNLKGASTITGNNATFIFNTGSGRVKFNGSAAQTLSILGGNLSIARVELNNSAGLTVSGAAVDWRIINLLLTSGTLTHNGLLNMGVNATDRIVRNAGSLAAFAAAGPGEVEYIGTADQTTSFELPSTLNKLIVNAASGNPTFTLDKNVTILTSGQLNLSRGTLATSTNSLIVQTTNTVIRAEGAISGTPSYGSNIALKYFNTASDLTTGSEFTNDGSVTSLEVNAPGRIVNLGSNVRVDGSVQLDFGNIELGNYTLQISGTPTLNQTVTASGTGKLRFTGNTVTLAGIATTYPNMEFAKTAGQTFNFPAATARTVNGNFVVTSGNVAIGGETITVNGNFDVQSTAGTFNDNTKTVNVKGNYSVGGTATSGPTMVLGGTFVFNGTSNQTISHRPHANAHFNKVTVNNSTGVTLNTYIVLKNGATLTLTSGAVTTGSYYVQLGTTASAGVDRTNGYIVGNLYRWANSGTEESYLFPLGTATGVYRPITVTFTSGVSTTQMIRVSHTNAAPTGTVGIPFTTGTITINKLTPAYWTVGMYDEDNTDLLTPATNPKITVGAGGFTYGDITKIRSVYRLTNDANTWLLPGTFDGSYYDMNGVATVIHSGIQGWALEPQQLFAIGYQSNLAVANAIAAQTLTVGGAAYTKTIQASPAVFSGAIGALTYTVSSSVPAVATASESAGVLTVTAVSAGTAVITLTATDVNGDQVSTTFNVTAYVTPTFTLPAVTTYSMKEGTTQNVTFAASATGQTVALSMLAGNPVYATFTSGTGVLALAPGFDVVTTGSKTDSVTIRATASPSGLTTDQKIYVTVSDSNRAPVFIAQLTSRTIKNDSTLTFTYTATDADGQALSYSLVPITPTFAGTAAVGTSTGVLTFTPVFADAGKTFSVRVNVTDGTNTVTSTAASVTVEYRRSKGDVNGDAIINDGDAVVILRHVVGLTPITGDENRYAADVNNDGTIGALDAAWVLYYFAFGSFPLGKLGAVNGEVSWGDVTNKSDIVTIPLKLSGGTNVLSAFVSLTIDKNLASLENVSSSLPGGWQIVHHVTDAGKLNIALAGLKPLEDGNFVNLSLKLLNKEAKMNIEGSAALNDELTSMLKSLSVRQIPTQFGLSQNYPNPFNPTTKIQYQLPQNANVKLAVYDMLGQKVKTLLSSEQEAGYYTVEWNGLSDNGTYVTSGLYVYRLEAGSYVATKKMNFVK
jgi:hypothetical protein